MGGGWWCCEGGGGDPCGYCIGGVAPASITITLGGYLDKTIGIFTCECFDLNGTYVVPALPGYACNFEYNATFPCFDEPNEQFRIRASVQVDPGGNVRWFCGVDIDNAAETTFIWNSGDTIAIDCTATRTLPLISHSANFCLGTPTCQIN